MIRLLLILLLLAVPTVGHAHKAIGIFALASCLERPSYATFAMVADYHDFDAAKTCAETTGIRYVLALYSHSHYEPVEAHARAVKARADASGLTPYLLGVVMHEEWYEYALAPGVLPIGDLDPARDVAAIVSIVHWWVGQQHAALGRVWPGLPRVWLTSLVNDTRAYGDGLWRPVPDGVDVIALEAYTPNGATFDGRPFAHLIATRREPVVVVAQGFSTDGQWSDGPTPETIARTGELVAHPRVIAAWIFDWKSRPNIVGLSARPDWRAAYEIALGVR